MGGIFFEYGHLMGVLDFFFSKHLLRLVFRITHTSKWEAAHRVDHVLFRYMVVGVLV